MKTLKKDDINEKLLLETYAYVVSHENTWAQGSWRVADTSTNRCKTPMCFAGHAAITLGCGKDVLPFPKPAAWKAWREGASDAEELRASVREWMRYSDYLLATKKEIDEGLSEVLSIDGVDVHAVEIMDRAERLLGPTAVGRDNDLFGGCNDIENIRGHIADVLGLTDEQVDEKARKIAEANRWLVPKLIDAEHITGWEG